MPPSQTNPLDFLIDVSSVDTRDEDAEQESRKRVSKLVQCWKQKELVDQETCVTTGRKSLDVHQNVSADSSHTGQETATSGKRPNVLQQIAILVPRASQNMVRGYPELVGHFVQAIMLGLVMGITFFRLGGQPNDIQSLKTLAFQVIPVYGYMVQVVWIFKWCSSLVVFDREREDNLYSPAAWVVSEMIAWVPVNIIAPAIYAIFVYFVCNMRTDDLSYNFGVFIIDMIMCQMCFVAWALFAASIEVCSCHRCEFTPSDESSQRSFARASLLGNALVIFFILSTGFFIVNVPGWIRWFRWLSPYFFSFRVIVISQFRNRTFSCDGVTGPAASQCSGENVLRGLRISPSQPLWPMFLGILGFYIVVTALAWFLLTVWKPGGVRHAARVASESKGKELADSELDILRTRVDVTADTVKLFHVKRNVPSLERIETPILSNISARFPSGEVSVILGPSGSGKSTFLRMCAGRPLTSGLLGKFQSQGEIRFNDTLVSRKTRHICAFVEQGTHGVLASRS